MTVRAHQHQRGRPISAAARLLLPILLAMSVTALFVMVWQSVDEQSRFASLERDGIRYIQELGPLEIALTNAGTAALGDDPAAPADLGRAVAAVAAVDRDLGERLSAQDRWAGLRAKIEALPADGTDQEIIAAYGTVNDLLLALMDKVRNSSQLVRDPSADLFYLGDGAAQELPESIVAASRYTNLLLTLSKLPASERPAALIEINTEASGLASNARDLSDDIRLAVEESGTQGLGSALLSRLDRYNRAVDNLLPLASARNGVNTEQVTLARGELQTAAAELSAALLTQIGLGLDDRISTLDQRRLTAIGILVVSVLAALIPVGLSLAGRIRRTRAARNSGTPGHAPAHAPAGAWPGPDSRPEAGQDQTLRRRISVP
ncbi:hypothetical protein Aph02nite_14660 [Actinoplanes philippinensis]|nr:hypothetical protein [Actinoplanes philippinensis]GIE75516.1 hypothetical protein Aph02nite_14660 [Actinoplanes philippinensis]